jgi:hypothetical protein
LQQHRRRSITTNLRMKIGDFMTARDLMTTGDYMTISYSIGNTPDEIEPKSKMPRVAIFGKKELFTR